MRDALSGSRAEDGGMNFQELQELKNIDLTNLLADTLNDAQQLGERIPYAEGQVMLMVLETLRYRVLRSMETYPRPKEVQ
jgi:hypothetical protein